MQDLNPQQKALVDIVGKSIGCLAVILFVLVGLPIGYGIYRNGTPEAKERRAKIQQESRDEIKYGSAFTAEAIAYDFVTERCNYPGTTDFLPGSLVVNTLNRWKVEGLVDTANEYGTPVRHRYEVIMEYNPSTKSFALKSLDLRPTR